MALLSIANLSYALGDRPILDNVNLTIQVGEHVGLVGRNGCGKTTLLRMIAGEGAARPDTGQIQTGRDATLGYLRQDPDLESDRTLRDEAASAFEQLFKLHEQLEDISHQMGEATGDDLDRLMKRYEKIEHGIESLGGYAVDHRIDSTLHGLGIDDQTFNVKVRDLSGGQRSRLALAKLLLAQPDLLLLDEPTNHLDILGRAWLEKFLAEYPGGVILVSHDRWLLDRCTTSIYEMEFGRLEQYPGNYTKYRELRAERRLAQQRQWKKQQGAIKRQQEFIDRYRAGQRAKQARGREARLKRYIENELIEKPLELDAMKLTFEPKQRAGDQVVRAEHIAKRYDDNTLFEDFTFTINRGDCIGIIGPNGFGKTTLTHCMLGLMDVTEGKVRVGSNVDVGHYRQTHDHLDLSLSVVQYLQPFTPGGTEQEARDLAGAFLFSDLDQDKVLGDLSGGERSRAVLAGLMTVGHNVLVLDEPTNHLDIPSSERLEEALQRYAAGKRGQEGTLLLITHDRMLLDHVVDQLLIFEPDGSLKHFLGTYHEYLDAQRKADAAAEKAAREHEQAVKAQAAKQQKKPPSRKTDQPKKSNPPTGLERLSLAEIEQKIEQIESRIAEIDQSMSDPKVYQNGKKVRELSDERESLSEQLTPLEFEWSRRADRQ